MSDLSVKKSRRCTDEAMLAFREEILETATELFAEQGFSDAVTQALAAKLQVGKGTIYRHFPSKRELFLAAADRVMQKLQERVEANIAGITDGFERITKAVAAFLAFFRRASPVRRAADSGAGLLQGPPAADLLRAPRDQHPAVAAVVSRADRGRTSPGDAGRAHHRRGEQHALRNHGHQLFQRARPSRRICRR